MSAEDRDAVRELLAEYCMLMDSWQLETLAERFAPDGLWRSRFGEARGPADILQLLQRIVPRPLPGRRRMHLTTNVIVRLDGDAASARSNFLVVQDGDTGPAIAVAGTYEDCLARCGGGWRFRSRILTHDMIREAR